MLRWNKGLWLDFVSHMTLKPIFISVMIRYATLKFVSDKGKVLQTYGSRYHGISGV